MHLPFDIDEISGVLSSLLSEQSSFDATLHLTANENVMSETARSFLASNLGYRYYTGVNDSLDDLSSKQACLYKGFMFRNLLSVYSFEKHVHTYANKMFHSKFCDFKPLSGLHAVFCILATVTKPNDCVYIFTPDSVGHYATAPLIDRIGRRVFFMPWCYKNFTIDLDKLAAQFSKVRPDAIFFDFGTPLYPLPIKDIRALVGSEVPMIYDASHVLGLIAGGKFQNPIDEGCDILVGNTHKTFPGPQKAMLLFRDEKVGRKIVDMLCDMAVSSQHTHHLIALYVTIIEMMLYGEQYAVQVVKNNHALSEALEDCGFQILNRDGEYPCSHIVTLTGPFKNDNHNACEQLQNNYVNTNSRKMFGIDSIRIGVQEVTRRGMKEPEMRQIAGYFKKILFDDMNIANEIREFNAEYQQVSYSLDQIKQKILRE